MGNLKTALSIFLDALLLSTQPRSLEEERHTELQDSHPEGTGMRIDKIEPMLDSQSCGLCLT